MLSSARSALVVLAFIAVCHDIYGDVVRLRCGDVVTRGGSDHAARALTQSSVADAGVYIVQFDRELHSRTRELVAAAGAHVCGYVPERALIVRGSAAAMAAVAELPGIVWIGAYEPNYKIDPVMQPRTAAFGAAVQPATNKTECVVSVWDAAALGDLRAAVYAQGGSVVQLLQRGERGALRVQLPAGALPALAQAPAVEWIEPYAAPHFCNDIATSARGINVSNVWHTLGVTGAGQLVGHADSGIDTGDAATLHPDLRGRIARVHALARENDWSDQVGHGTHTAGSIAGTGAAGHGGKFRGVAPGAQLVHQTITDARGAIGDIAFDVYALLAQAYEDGARIHSDSWGADAYGQYTWLARMADEFVWDAPEMLMVCAAGNNGWDANRDGVTDWQGIIAPATAKNVLSVGGAETWRAPGSGGWTAFTWYEYWPVGFPLEPLAGDYISWSADSVRRGMAAFSSRGPTADNRIKPELVAPATDVISCRSRARGASAGWGAVDEQYMFNGGTSVATPLVAGAAALAREYLVTRTVHTNPSAALVKAILLGGAQSLAPGQYGYGAQREIPAGVPNVVEGWGLLNVEHALAPASETLALLADGAQIETGMTNVYVVALTNPAMVRAWLVYSDYPASLASAVKLVNDLDIVVRTPAGSLHYDQRSQRPNRLDNVESVVCRATAGTCTIWVTGHQVPFGPQPYALLVRTAPLPAPVLRVEDVAHAPLVVRPEQPVTFSAHVANSFAGTLTVNVHCSTNRTAWFSTAMPRRAVTEHGGVHSVTLPGWRVGTHVAYFVEARVDDGPFVVSATNEFTVGTGEIWVAPDGTETPPYDTAATGLRTLAAAARHARAGSVIMVAPGTYRERRIRIKPFVRMVSAAGADTTIIDAGGRGGPCVILAGQGAVLEGFTLRGARTDGDGGGARLYAGAALLSCIVRENRAARYGGGVYMQYGGVVSNCIVSRNMGAYGGGGVFCNGHGLITDLRITGNRTHRAYGEGGGVVVLGPARLVRSRVERNRAMLSGGGIWCSDGAEVAEVYVAGNRAGVVGGGINAPRSALVRSTMVVNNYSRRQGGGIRAGSGSHITHCSITANRAREGGGLRTFSALVTDCTVSSNRAQKGGGVFSNSGLVSNVVVMANLAREGGGMWCEYLAEPRALLVKDNRARTGGGMFLTRDAVVKNCCIVGNTAREGGGMALHDGALAAASVIHSNTARMGGGVCTLPGGNSTLPPRLATSYLEYNHALRGGGAWLRGEGLVRSCLFAHNSAARDAGAAGLEDNTMLENCLLTRNTARRSAGGVAGSGGSIVNTIVYGNSAPHAPEYDTATPALTFTHSCVSPLPPGPGNIALNPRLASKAAGYRSSPSSPCIDGGRPATWMYAETDITGAARVLGAAVDMGCYEYSSYEHDQPPLLVIHEPTPWQVFPFDNKRQIVRGVVMDDYGTFPVMRAARPVRSFTPPHWSDHVELAVGTNVLRYTVTDAAGHAATATVVCILLPRYDGPVVVNTTVYVAHTGAHLAPFSSWQLAATNLSAALLAAGDGCTIMISNGHYRLAETAELYRPVTLRGAGHVVLDGQGARRCLTLFAAGITLDNLVISNGMSSFGGGIYARYDAKLLRCRITDNRAGVHGGGILGERALTLHDTRIHANRAGQRGGGVFAVNEIVARACVIDANHADADAGGMWSGYAARIYDTVFRFNSASNDGGGLVCAALGDVRACVFEHNRAARGGGARVLEQSHVFNSICRYNYATDGGGLAAENSRVRNVLCHDNTAANTGGGVLSGPGGALENCTLVFNSARRGGGAWCTHGTRVRNTILYFNTQGNLARRGADVLVSFSCTTPATPGAGVITAPPQFADARADDFRLAPHSPCIDAAERLVWMARSVDLHGTPRVTGAAPDIGAFEFTPGAPATNTLARLAHDLPEPCVYLLLLLVLAAYCSRAARQHSASHRNSARPM